MHPLRVHYDKLLLVAALLLCGAGAGWSLRERNSGRQLLGERDETNLMSPVPETDQAVATMDKPGPTWEEPDAHVGADEPQADLFTPPMRRSHGVQGKAASRARTEADEEGSALELLAVNKERHRLQLAGYAGRTGSYRVVLADAANAGTVVVGVGQRIADLGVTLLSFEIRQTAVAENEAGAVHEAVAVAVLKDEATGKEWTVDNRGPSFTGRLLAAIRVTKDDREIWQGGEGDSLPAAGLTYRVELIRSDPAEVILARIKPGQPAESLTLRVTSEEARPPVTAVTASGGTPRVVAHRE